MFSEKAVFSEETAKNCSGVAFDHFLVKGDVLPKKLIQPFLSRIMYRILFSKFFEKKKQYFQKKE